ncbi:Glycoprotein 3-alpha-L-fucosyltransferase A [Schistosoma japonicum]|nr:Glycoprotein 3-alpha-L-fucosyltransferase A [Schistosoma japonicum]
MVDIYTTIVENNKWRFRMKSLFLVFTALFIIWLINATSNIISRSLNERDCALSSETVEWIYTNMSTSNQSSHLNLANTLNKIYSPITQTSAQKYSLRFSLEESRLQRLYDSLSGNKTIKKFLNYGHRTIFTPMDFSNCHASKCTVINDMKRWREADAIILTEDKLPDGKRPNGQLWFTLIHESPVHIAIAGSLVNEVNFTISFRLDSTIYSPYGSYQPFVKHDGPETRYPLPSRNFAVGKSKKVAWFVSNCIPKSPRMQYAKELARHISVDIYGQCGTLTCPKNVSTFLSTPECLKKIRENYKFYLSFENSLCSEYITEKLYRNALNNDILPIVMGASIEEYERVAPPYSFIHVDQFESPAKLAEYLKYLDSNDTAYNEYFAWHGHGIVHDWDSQPQCAMCLLAHTSDLFGPYWVPNVARWWNTGCDGRRLRWTP